jgi:ribonuclease Z
MVDICLLGCGGMMPLPNRWLTSLLFRHNGKMILVDCGEGTQIPLKLAGWGFKAIDAICFTHYHADHIVGLPGLLLTMGNSGRTEPLTIFGPKNLFNIIKGILVIAPQLPFEIKLVELSNEDVTTNYIDDVIIKSIPVTHSIDCLAYSFEITRMGKFDSEKAKNNNVPMKFWSRLQKGEGIELEGELYTPEMVLGKSRKGLKVSYCTDARPDDAISEFANDSDLFICEGMYGDDEKLEKVIEKKHMLFSEAAMLARKGNVGELWLTHYSPALENPEEYLHYAKNIFENTVLGHDLLKQTLKFEDDAL